MEEDDYMNDSFLNACVENDIRPGLLHAREKRKHSIFKNKEIAEKKNKTEKPKKIIEAERREEGLAQAISSSNKGFSMLQRMGYTPGSGLGKSSSGITTPVPVLVKTDRQGLGREEALKQIKIQKQRIRAKQVRSNTISVEDYRLQLSKQAKEREVCIDLSKSQKACFELDTKSMISTPAESWFWMAHCLPKRDEDEEDVSDEEVETDFEPHEKLEMLTLYLRESYYYCVWCGVQYEDEVDLQSCPGTTREDH